mgnify:CR=1 FL=1
MAGLIRYKIVVSDQASSPIDKDARIAELETALASRDTLITTLRFQLGQLRRMRFAMAAPITPTQSMNSSPNDASAPSPSAGPPAKPPTQNG